MNMNNSLLAIETVSLSMEAPQDIQEKMREREAVVVKIIKAIETIESSEEWSTLKTLIFDSHLDKLEKSLKTESEQSTLSPESIYRLQGELKWSRKYADLQKLADEYRNELVFIRKNITTERVLNDQLVTQPTER